MVVASASKRLMVGEPDMVVTFQVPQVTAREQVEAATSVSIWVLVVARPSVARFPSMQAKVVLAVVTEATSLSVLVTATVEAMVETSTSTQARVRRTAKLSSTEMPTSRVS
jgi:hypothetical protein